MGLFDRWKSQPTKKVHQDLVAVYQEAVTKLISSTDEQLQFLEYAAQLYKYHFDSLLAAYAQAPNAKYLADFDTWRKVGRQVTKGSKAIKILHQNEKGYFYHENLFDVTHTTGKNVNFPNWLLSEQDFSDTLKKLATMKENEMAFVSDQPRAILFTLIENHVLQASEERLSDAELEHLTTCVEYMTLYKLGQFPADTYEVKAAAQALFSSIDQVPKVFPTVLHVTRQVLTDVAAAKVDLTKERKNEHMSQYTKS